MSENSEILQRLTKTQVKSLLKQGKPFVGYFAGSKVNLHNVNGGWHCGVFYEITSLDQFNRELTKFEAGLKPYTSEFGSYTKFYLIKGE